MIRSGVGRMEVGSSGKRLSVLLASASAGGTIAAVRHLGAAGLNVRVISSKLLSAAAWSHYVSHSYRAPLEVESHLFLELLAIGTAAPGQILLPTSDHTAWLYTVNAALLGRHFRVYQPSIESMRRIRDKKLFAHARPPPLDLQCCRLGTRETPTISPHWLPACPTRYS